MKNRRHFLKTTLALGASISVTDFSRLLALDVPSGPATGAAPRSTLVAVRDGERGPMLDRALAELGGIGAFVKPGQTVAIKPNIGWDCTPERGANTHPELIGRLIALCREVGAKSVAVFDNPCDQWQRAYANSGIEEAAKSAGASLVNGKDEAMYREVAIPGGVNLKSALVHSLYLDSDVIFNVPVLKHHSGAAMTAAIKNLMGVVWNRRQYHINDMHQCMADFLTFRAPTLNILDAYHPMVRNGPRGRSLDDVVVMRTLLASTDIVALDAAGARLLGHEPAAIRHIKIAADMNLGRLDLPNLDVRRLKMA